MCTQDGSETWEGRHELLKWVAATYKPNPNKKPQRRGGLMGLQFATPQTNQNSSPCSHCMSLCCRFLSSVRAGLGQDCVTSVSPLPCTADLAGGRQEQDAAASKAEAGNALLHTPQSFRRHCACLRHRASWRSRWAEQLCIPMQACEYDIWPSHEYRKGSSLPHYYASSWRLQGRYCVQLYFYWMKTENICKWLKW